MAIRASLGLAALGAVALLWTSAVDNALTPADRAAIAELLGGAGLEVPPPDRSFAEEIRFIRGVQQAVLRVAPMGRGIPPDRMREPRDLLEAGTGLCFDRSRVIEKVLRAAGFRTRHVALYATDERAALVALVVPGSRSHAVSEVLTREGWLVVDSNRPWVSLTRSGEPVPIAGIARDVAREEIEWEATRDRIDPTFLEPFTWVYGLYSRHGRFYPPFNAVPDLHWGELSAHLLEPPWSPAAPAPRTFLGSSPRPPGGV